MENEQQTNKEFRESIITSVDAEVADSGDSSKLVFLREMLTYLDGLTSEWGEDPDYYVDERVQASHFSEDFESLDIIVSDYHGKNTLISSTYSTKKSFQKRFRACQNVFRAGLNGEYRDFEESNELRGFVKSVYEHQSELKTIRYILITDYTCTGELPDEETEGEYKVKYEVWSLDDVYRLHCSEQISSSNLEINLVEDFGERIPCLKVDFGESAVEYSSYLGFMKAGLLADLYDKYNEKLLEGNIRVFLQTTTSVNKGILSTLSHETEKTRFFAYNNGISATADSVTLTEPDENGFRWIETVRGLQIVNGGQTTASIHTAKKKNSKNVDGVYVQMKLTVPLQAGDIKGLNEKIAKYSNTQNQIKKADFTANVAYQILLANLSRKVLIPGHEYGWFYERIRGQYSEQERLQTLSQRHRKNAVPFESRFPKSRKLTKTDIALHYNAWNQYPQFAAKGGEKNYQKFLSILENADGEIDIYPDVRYFRELISMSILFIRTDTMVNEWQKGGGSQYGNGYKREILLYTISLLSYLTNGRFNLERIWDYQFTHGVTKKTFRLPEPLEGFIKQLIILAEHHIRHPPSHRSDAREWAKTDECWQTFRDQKAGNKHPQVPDEIVRMFYLSDREVAERQKWLSSLRKSTENEIVPVEFVRKEDVASEIPEETVPAVEEVTPVPEESGTVSSQSEEGTVASEKLPDFWRLIATARHSEWCKLSDRLIADYELSEDEIASFSNIKKRKASYLGVLESDLSVSAKALIRLFTDAISENDQDFFEIAGLNPEEYLPTVVDKQEVKNEPVVTLPSALGKTFEFKGENGLSGLLSVTPNGLTLQKKAVVLEKMDFSVDMRVVRMRNNVLGSGKLWFHPKNTSLLVVGSNLRFQSPADAASFIVGSNHDGKNVWFYKGQPLENFELPNFSDSKNQ